MSVPLRILRRLRGFWVDSALSAWICVFCVVFFCVDSEYVEEAVEETVEGTESVESVEGAEGED